MQIREKGKQILCIRTEYVSEKRRTIGRTVATQDKYASTVCDEVRQRLTNREVDQLEIWLSERKNRQSVASLKSGLSFVAYAVCRAAEALSVDGLAEELSPEKADKIWQSMEELQKALKKAGFKRPVRPPATAPALSRNYELPINN
jgi:hypothetical protein